MRFIDRIVSASGVSEADIRSITELEWAPIYELRLWNRRRVRVGYFEVVNAR